MAELLKRFFQICLLAKGPQDIPHSSILMRVLLVVYFITGLLSMLPSVDMQQAVLEMALDLVVLLVFVWFCLQAFHKQARYVQTVSALAAIGALFQLLAWPLLAYLEAGRQAGDPVSELSLLLLLIVSWNLAVYAHIFRESFSIRMLAAFIMTIAYAVINISVRQILY